MKPGSRNLITDVSGLRVGNAQCERLKSGVTVLTADAPFTASIKVLGGAPGTRETDLLAPDKSVEAIDALVLSGGSAFGLDACGGVMEALHNHGRGFPVGSARVPIVPGAIIFDLLNGGEKEWTTPPYRELGQRAYACASEGFEQGSVGAGTGALTGMLKGGLGSASLRLADGVTVGALMAVNPMGCVTTPGARHFWAAPYEIDGEFGGLGPDPSTGLGRARTSRKLKAIFGETEPLSNTTIGIVATDAPLSKAACHRMAAAAHAGIARAIVPSHTPADGDLMFGMSTASHDGAADLNQIGHAAALCVSRAIARAVYFARKAPGDLLPCWGDQAR